VFSFLMIC